MIMVVDFAMTMILVIVLIVVVIVTVVMIVVVVVVVVVIMVVVMVMVVVMIVIMPMIIMLMIMTVRVPVPIVRRVRLRRFQTTLHRPVRVGDLSSAPVIRIHSTHETSKLTCTSRSHHHLRKNNRLRNPSRHPSTSLSPRRRPSPCS